MAGRFGSVITAMATPFRDDFSIDLDRAQELASWLLDHGSDGLVVFGSTGEAATQSDAEKRDLLRAVKEAAAGRGSIIAGTGTYDTHHSIELTRMAEDLDVYNLSSLVRWRVHHKGRGLFMKHKACSP